MTHTSHLALSSPTSRMNGLCWPCSGVVAWSTPIHIDLSDSLFSHWQMSQVELEKTGNRLPMLSHLLRLMVMANSKIQR